LIAAVNATISLYYYLQVVRAAYVKPPADDSTIPVSASLKWCAVLAMVMILCLGLYPDLLMDLCVQAAAVVAMP